MMTMNLAEVKINNLKFVSLTVNKPQTRLPCLKQHWQGGLLSGISFTGVWVLPCNGASAQHYLFHSPPVLLLSSEIFVQISFAHMHCFIVLSLQFLLPHFKPHIAILLLYGIPLQYSSRLPSIGVIVCYLLDVCLHHHSGIYAQLIITWPCHEEISFHLLKQLQAGCICLKQRVCLLLLLYLLYRKCSWNKWSGPLAHVWWSWWWEEHIKLVIVL